MAAHDDKQAEARRRRAQEFARNDEHEINAAIALLLERREGRRFLWWLLEIGGVSIQPFAGESSYTTAFNCGILNVGNTIQGRIIEASPNGYLTLQQENAIEHRERSASINADEPDPRSGNAGYAGRYDSTDFDDA